MMEQQTLGNKRVATSPLKAATPPLQENDLKSRIKALEEQIEDLYERYQTVYSLYKELKQKVQESPQVDNETLDDLVNEKVNIKVNEHFPDLANETASQWTTKGNVWFKTKENYKNDNMKQLNNIINNVILDNESRKQMVILFGVPESKSEDNQKENDTMQVQEVFESIGFNKNVILNLFRLKRTPNQNIN